MNDKQGEFTSDFKNFQQFFFEHDRPTDERTEPLM